MNSGMLGRTLLDQFRVDSFVAAGGMATVYRVYDLKRNVPLAMKVLQEDLAEDPAILKRFQREAEALTRLAHPHIVTFYGLFQDGALSFLLERFIDGPTLKDILKNRPGQALALPEVAIWMKAVCSALGYAHANGLVHCDIKPGNVMVDHGGIVYLADFGIARYADTSTTTIASAGTPAYMAPEQIQGMAVSPATDIYALGVVLFELLTGRRPFTGSETGLDSTGGTTGERIRYAHLHLQPPDPRSINPALPLALSWVILQAMAKDPAQRFTSTQALFNALCAAGEIRAEEVPDRLDLRWLAPVVGQESETKPATQEASVLPSPPTWQDAAEAKNTRKRPAAWLWGIGAGCVLAVAALIIFGVLALAGIIKLLPAQPTAVSAGAKSLQAPQSTLTTTAPPAGQIAVTQVEVRPEATPTLVVFAPTNTKALTPTGPNTCPGAKPQRVEAGGRGSVCTKKDRLILRKDPTLTSAEVRRIPTGTEFKIISGPKCGEDSSWWLIQTDDGTSGWVREGSDEVDPYFICPVFRD